MATIQNLQAKGFWHNMLTVVVSGLWVRGGDVLWDGYFWLPSRVHWLHQLQ